MVRARNLALLFNPLEAVALHIEKSITINIGNYQSLKIGVSEVTTFQEADQAIIAELQRLDLQVGEKIKQSLNMQKDLESWV